ncbi:MAG: FG-GAP repeat domain-containing protein [Promethearchaeota archaeon]
MIKNKLLISILTFLLIGSIIIQIVSLPTNNYMQTKIKEKDDIPINEIEPIDLGILQRNYKADGSIMEVEEGINQADSTTPGVELGDHPLGIDQIRFIPNNELAFVCPGLPDFVNLNDVKIKLLENGIASPPYQNMLDIPCSYEATGGQVVDATSGDVDGDMKDELVIIDEYGRVRIYKYNSTLKKFNITQYDLDISEEHYFYSLSLNQFNTDLGLEIVIGCGYGEKIQIWDPVNAVGNYYSPGVQTTINGEYGGIAEFHITENTNLMDLETGDFNGNGFPDIVTLAMDGDLLAFEFNSGVINQLCGVELSSGDWQGYPHNFPMGLATGDFNGDSRLDIAVMVCDVAGSPEDIYHCEYYYVQTVYWKGFSAGGEDFVDLGEMDMALYNVFFPSIGAGDIDGDGLSETVLVGKSGYGIEGESWVVLIFDDWAIPQTSPIVTFSGESQCPWAAKSFSFSDVDLDGIDEICFSSVEKYGNIYEEKYLEQLEGRNTSVVKINTETNPWTATVLFSSTDIIGYPVPGDYDGDAVVIEYSGQHFPRITPQIPIFVLAAPPNYFDLNGDGSGTAVSKEETTSMDVTERFSVMAGMRVSFETGFELFGTGLKFKTSLEVNYQFSQTQTTTQTETIGVRYSSGHMENQIICNAIDYESYLYVVTKHPKSEMIGKNMSIDVPIKASIYSITESLYNSGNSTNYIGSETYTHTPGKPETYPTREEVNALVGVVKIIDKIEVPQGTGTSCGSTLKYTRENAKSVEKERAMQLIFSAGMEAGGFGLDISVGFGLSRANKVTYGESMTYEGTVACISDANDWMNHKYSWGLFIQNIEPDEGFSYQLVHYYVEDVLSDGTPSEAVPGYNPILVIGVLIISLIVLIYFKKPKK